MRTFMQNYLLSPYCKTTFGHLNAFAMVLVGKCLHWLIDIVGISAFGFV